jgi:multidrug efflux pump subunit AcrA (membrane-fusion protein)
LAGQVKPAAGGEVVLTPPWTRRCALPGHTGLDVGAGGPVFRLIPRVGDRSLPELRADVSSLEADVQVARRRVERLTELLRVEATSEAELERARAGLQSLEARLAAARGGLGAASTTGGPDAASDIVVRAPWAGRVAEVSVSPGQTVAAGAVLGRLVKVRPLWLVVALRPEDAARVQGAPEGLTLRRAGQPAPLELAAGDVSSSRARPRWIHGRPP